MNLTEAITAFDEAKKALINEGWKSPEEVTRIRTVERGNYSVGYNDGYEDGYDAGHNAGRDYNF